MPRQPKPQPRPCIGKDCKRDTRSQSQVCLWCQRQGRESGPEVSARCLSCGSSTGREDRLCSGCAYHYANAHAYEPRPEDDLTGGQWVRVGNVMRWQRDPIPAGPVPRVGRRPQPAKCGTERGYQKHRHLARRHGAPWPLDEEDECGCIAAHAAHEREKYHRHKGRERLRLEASYRATEDAA